MDKIRPLLKDYPVTLCLLLTSVLLQVLITAFPPAMNLLGFGPTFLAPFTLFSHMVAHANWKHLLGNYCFGMPYMLYLEKKLKDPKEYLAFFVLCGLGSAFLNMAAMGFESGMIGSSGAIMGMMAGACMAFGSTKVEHGLGLLVLGFYLIMNLLMAPYSADYGIAYYGHVGGALTGLVLSCRLFQSSPLE